MLIRARFLSQFSDIRMNPFPFGLWICEVQHDQSGRSAEVAECVHLSISAHLWHSLEEVHRIFKLDLQRCDRFLFSVENEAAVTVTI